MADGEPKRVLMLLENAGFPDDCRVALEAFALVEAGYRVTVICPTDETTSRLFEDVQGVATYRYPGPPEWGGFIGYCIEYGYSLSMAFLLSLYVAFRQGFDAIHVHTPPDMYVMIGWFYKIFGVKYVMDHHDISPELYVAQTDGGNPIVLSVLRFFERWSCRTADQLIATNESQRRIQIDRCGVEPEKTNVVRNGPDLSRFIVNDESLASELEQPKTFVIGYMGCIGFQDGVDELIRALGHLSNQMNRKDFRGLIIGDGPALSSLKDLAGELGLEQTVDFAGYQRGESLLQHLRSCHILTTPDPPSDYNMTCTMIKTMEYMAMRRPIVGYDLPEHRFSAGEASLYAEPGNIEHFAECLASLMDDPERRREMGLIGRERVETKLSWAHQSPNLIAAYGKLFGQETAHKQAAVETDHAAVGQ